MSYEANRSRGRAAVVETLRAIDAGKGSGAEAW
jgi:hypothetical protein